MTPQEQVVEFALCKVMFWFGFLCGVAVMALMWVWLGTHYMR